MAVLDPDQAAAVGTGPVDVFISAGAGAGKTRVLTARFVAAVLGEPPYPACDPASLLTVTYTDKAATELAVRIRRALSEAGRDDAARKIGHTWISTIHGMCARILRRYALDAGVDPYFAILDPPAASVLEFEALETAMRALISEDPATADLLEAWGTRPLAAKLREMRMSVYALGLTGESIGTVSMDDASGAVRAAVDRLHEVADSLEQLTPRTASVRGAVEVVRNVIAASVRFGDEGCTCAAGVLHDISATGMRADRTPDGLAALVTEARGLIEDARRSVAQCHVAVSEFALLRLLRRYEAEYVAVKQERAALDFEDLQLLTARLLSSRPDIAHELRSRFGMVMIDEFQDANALQRTILEGLSGNNLCTVGDENQSIYSFRHADVEVFRQRSAEVACRRELLTNYRIEPRLLSAITGMFSHPALFGRTFSARSPEDVECDNGPGDSPVEGGVPDVRFVDSGKLTGDDRLAAEAACIADSVARLLAEGRDPGDVAVLMQQLRGGRGSAVEKALEERGIPVFLAAGGSFYDTPEIIEARNLLRVIDNVLDDTALVAFLAGRLVGLSADALMVVRRHADRRAQQEGLHRRDVHLWGALQDCVSLLSGEDAVALEQALAVVHDARRQRGSSPLAALLREALEALDADLVLLARGDDGARAWANILKLVRWAQEYEAASAGGVSGFLRYLDEREEHSVGEQEAVVDAEASAVRVMSIHSAKGLEFPAVVLSGFSRARSSDSIALAMFGGQPLLGMKARLDGETIETLGWARVTERRSLAAAEEQKRLLYVGCTRAERYLTVVVLTDPGKPADETLGGLVRQVCGCGEAETIVSGVRQVGQGRVRISLVRPDDHEAGVVRSGRVEAAGEEPQEPDHAPMRPGRGNAPRCPVSAPSAATQAVAGPLTVSYTALSTYQGCPYRYYLTMVVRLGLPPRERETDRFAFGSAVHAVLEQCHSPEADVAAMAGPAAAAAGLAASEIPRLERAAEAFLTSPTAREALGAPVVTHEVPIAVPVAGSTLVGSIDLFARFEDRALIVDYKTGVRPLSESEARQRYRLQGECYALAALASGADEVRVVFSELERGREVSFAFRESDRATLESTLCGIIDKMRTDLRPRADYEEGLCESCPGLGGMCPMDRPPGRGVG